MDFILDISFALQNVREAQPEFLVAALFYLGEGLLGCSVFVSAAIHWCVDKRLGQRMLFSYAVGYGLNQTVKNIACVYRPWILDNRLSIAPIAQQTATGYSFPSGHTVGVTSVLSSLTIGIKKAAPVVLALLAIFAICFIRIFVGAHTLLDVVCAVIIAAFAASLMQFLLTWAEREPGRDVIFTLTGILLTTVVSLYLCTKPYPMVYAADSTPLVDQQTMMIDVFKAAAMLYGAFLGWLFERKLGGFSSEGTFRQRILRFLAGAAIVGVWFVASKHVLMTCGASLEVAEFIKHFVLIFLMLGIYPALISRWQKARC